MLGTGTTGATIVQSRVEASVPGKDLSYISGQIVDAAMCMHTALGPGLLQRTYSKCLAQELRLRGFAVALEVPVPIVYKGVRIRVAYRMDQLVEGVVVVELVVVRQLHPVHEAKLLS